MVNKKVIGVVCGVGLLLGVGHLFMPDRVEHKSVVGGSSYVLKEFRPQKVESVDKLILELDKKSRNLSKDITLIDKELKKKEIKEAEKRRVQQLASRFSKSSAGINLTEKAGLSAEQINSLLDGTGLQGLGSAYVEAEENYGVNSLFLVALSVLESNWGNSYLAKEKNNIFGYKAYDSNPIQSAMRFNSKKECIMVVAEALKTNYLTPGGAYFNGYTVKDVNKCYASDPEWYVKVLRLMNRFLNELKS